MKNCLHTSCHYIVPEMGPTQGWKNPEYQRIAPYECGGGSNYPACSNFLTIPVDIYHTGKALRSSIKFGDHEELIETATRFFGIPANIVSTGGMIASYLKILGLISYLPRALTLTTIIAGLLLCVIEGCVDVVSLVRQHFFRAQFDFKLISHLKHLIVDFEPNTTLNSMHALSKMLNKDLSPFEKLIGKEQAEIIQMLVTEIQHEIEQHPELLPTIVSHYRPALEEVAKELLIGNLEKIQQHYLVITEQEQQQIEHSVHQHNPNASQQELLELQKKQMQITSTIKKNQLARRVRPWMVEEANTTINPLLKGMLKGECVAIHESLKFVDDMHTQTKKKTCVHIFGVIALIIAATSLITTATVCPIAIFYIFAVCAMTFSLLRHSIFHGTLALRGWSFEVKRLIPVCIRKRILANPGRDAPIITHSYQTVSVPKKLQHRRFEFCHTQQLDLQKQGFESFRHRTFLPPRPLVKVFA